MATYYKPQSPIQSGEDFIYPITTADQIMKSDKTRRLEQAGLIMADNSTSLGGVAAKDYALKTDTAPDSSKLGGKAPEYYIQPRNLLDNSDFTNPVNQRGQTSYTSAGYTIDRWKKEGTSTVTVSDSCVTIDNTGNSAEEVFIQQTDRSTAQKLIGKALTIAICVDEGTIYCGSGTVANDANSLVIYTERFDLTLHYFTAFSSYQTARLIVKPGKSVSVKWIALYEGEYTTETLPPYVPKGKHVEMLNCGVSLTPHNLLDNSDFRNPVNQRGKGDVNTQGDYPIDRWMFDKNGSGSSAGYDANYKYLYIVNNATDGSWAALYHNVPSEKLNVGTYTICFHEKLIGPISMLAIADDTVTVLESAMYEPDENGLIIAQFTISSRPSNKLLIAVYATQGITVAFDWAALYEGSYTADTLPPYVPKGYAAELAACNVADTGCTDRTLINENTTSIVTGFPQKPTSASKTVFTTPADGNFYLFATRGETAGYTLRVYILNQNDGTVAQFNYPAYYAYAVIGVMIPVKRGMKIMVNTDNSVETWTIHEQKFYY